MSGMEWLEDAVAWLGRNALLTLLPSLVIAWVCWQRWGSARVRWALVGLLLLKLVLPGLPGWNWSVPVAVEWPAEKAPEAVADGVVLADVFAAEGVMPTGPAWWAVVWALGVTVWGGLWAASLMRVNWLIRQNRVPAPARLVRLLEQERQWMNVGDCPELCVLRGWGQAAVHGCWRPRVLLPAAWVDRLGEEELRAVLRHELAHVRRRDVLWSTLGYAVAAVHWFHPLGWLALRRLRAEAELLCDEAALSGRGEAQRREYGRVLIRMMETFSTPPPHAVAAFARHKNDIQHRILMIAQPKTSQRWSRAAAWLILPTLSLALLTAGEKESPKSEERGPREGETSPRVGPREGVKLGDRYSSIAAIVNGEVITRSEVEREIEKSEGRLNREAAVEKLIEHQKKKATERESRTGPREGEANQRVGPRDGDKPREGARDGDRPKEGQRDGDRPRTGPRDGEMKKEGARDGDRPKEGERDGDRPREGSRDGDKPREGARDGEMKREGARDGDKPREGAREGGKPREGAREGEMRKEGMREGERGKEGDRAARPAVAPAKAQPMVVQLNAAGAVVNSEGRVIPDAEVKQRLTQLARSQPGQEIVLKGEKETRYESMVRILELLKGIDLKATLAP